VVRSDVSFPLLLYRMVVQYMVHLHYTPANAKIWINTTCSCTVNERLDGTAMLSGYQSFTQRIILSNCLTISMHGRFRLNKDLSSINFEENDGF